MKIILESLLWVNFVGCACANIFVLLRGLFKKIPGSMIPLIGGITGALAIGFSHFIYLRPFWWIALIIDVSWLLYLSALIKFLRGR